MSKTVFEKIIDKEIPATIEYEDSDVIAIQDIAPNAPVHILIIPKKPIPTLNDLQDSDAELVGKVFLVAAKLAKNYGVDSNGYRVVTNTNQHAGQTVFHLHFHLLAGEPLGKMNSGAPSSAPVNDGKIATASKGLTHSLREASIFVVLAIGLAIAFNAMNSNGLPLIKKEFERVVATDDDMSKYGLTDAPLHAETAVHSETIPSQQNSNSIGGLNNNAAAKLDPNPKNVPANNQSTSMASTDKTPKTTEVAPTSTFVAEPGVVKEITLAQFKRFIALQPYYLIDARTSESYAKAHIAGSVNFYGGEAQSLIPEMMTSVPRDRVILIYCDGGECELSHHIADVLKQFGYGPMFIFTGGWAEWIAQKK